MQPRLSCSLGLLVGVGFLSSGPASGQSCDPNDIFGPPMQVTSSVRSEYLAAVDLENDGDRDLLLISFVLDVQLYLNSGEGVFVPGGSIAVGQGHIVSTGDLNNDGFVDIVSARLNNNPLSVRFNNGDGTFAPAVNYFIGGALFSVVADLDSDGDLDVAVSDNAANTVMILMNDGVGNLSAPQTYQVAGGPSQIAAGDFDGDGDRDIVVAGGLGTTLTFIRNASQGIFTVAQTVPVSGLRNITAADLDGDGADEVAFGNPGSVNVFRHAGGFTFTQDVYPAANAGTNLVVGDLNGDGGPDIVVSARAGDAGMLMNQGDGTFGPQITIPAIDANSLVLADFNGDGSLDLVIGQEANPVVIRLNQCFIPVNFDQQPADLMVDAGQAAQFSVGVSIGTPPFTYQWRRNGTPLQNGSGVSGVDTDTLTLSSVDASDTDNYDVVVSNILGGVPSRSAILAVRGGGGGGACPYDLNNDGLLNFFDVSAYLSGYNAGCP